MSASNSQIMEQTEPLRGVKHVKPPVKPPVKPKPLVPPRPKEIPASSPENKSPLLSPTCSPCSPTLDIPSAIKISQLTGPQPYGTRRTSLKRWSSSVGEDVNPEKHALSPVENRSIDLPAKITAQPLSAPLKPLQTGPVWKGKSPFMLTTRGWGEQRITQSKDSNAVSMKSCSSVSSEDTDAQKKETTAHRENSNSHSRITPEEKVVTHVQDSITKSEKSPSVESEDATMASSRLGSSNRSAPVKEFQKKLSAPLQSDLYFESSKQASQYDHQEKITSIGSKIKEKTPIAKRESLQVQKSQIEEENEKTALVYDNQIPDVKSGLLACDGDIIVDQGHLEKRGQNPGDLQQIADVIPKHAEHTNTAFEQPSHHEKQEPKDISVPSVLCPPKPKERKKPSVQFIVPKADDSAEGPISMDSTPSESERRETKEYKKEDENADMRRWHGEDGLEKISVSNGQQKTGEEENQEKSAKVDEPQGYVRTQIANYTVAIDDNICKDPTDYKTNHRSDRHNTIQENIDVCQSDIHGSSFHQKETKLAYEEDKSSISYPTKLNEDVEHGNQPDNVVEDYRSFHKRQSEGDPAVKNVDYMPHFAHTPPDFSPRSEHENYEYSFHDSGTAYIHHYKSTMDHSECDDIKEPSHISKESQSEGKFPSREIHTHLVEGHPPSALTQSQEELTQLKNQASKLGYLEDFVSSKSEEVQLTNFGDPTYKSIQPTVESNISDHEGGLQYYNIHSQNLQDGEKRKHRVDESEGLDYSYSHVEEPMFEHAQSEEPMYEHTQSEEQDHTYEPSEELVSTFTKSKEMVHTYAPFEEQVHTHIASEEPVHTYTESEGNEHTYGTSDEPFNKYAQFEEPTQKYSQSEEEIHRYGVIKKPKYEYYQSEKLEQMYEKPEKQVAHNAESEEFTHSQEPSKTQTLTYEQHIKPIYTYDELRESYPKDTQIRETEMSYEQVYQHAKERYVQPEDTPENIIPHIKTESHYQQTQAEEPISKNSLSQKISSSEMPLELSNYLQAQSEMPNYGQTQTKDLDYKLTQSVELNYQQEQPEQPKYQKHSVEPNYQYKHSEESEYQEEHEVPNYQYKESEKSEYLEEQEVPNYQYKESEKSYYQEEHDVPNYQYKQSEKSYYQEEHDVPNYQYKQSEKSHYQEEHEVPNYQYKQSEKSYYQEHSEEPNYQNKQSEEPNYQYKHSEESYYKHDHSNEPNYQQEDSDEQYYQQEDSDEQNYQRKHSNEQNFQETRSEELNIKYSQQEILVHKNKDSEDPHSISYYSEQSEEKDGQIQEQKSKMIGEHNHRLTESIEEDYMNLHAAEKDSGHITSAEQDKPKSTLEKYLEQHVSDSAPEEYHHKDESLSETYHKELLLREQKLEYTQKEEPKTLDAHTVESEPQDHTDSKETDKHSQILESRTKEIQDTCAEDNLDKKTLNEKNINEHSELEEPEHIEDRSGEPKLSDEIHEECPLDTVSETDETPEENFDFLEGTNVLDTSLMRGRASLGKKRCHRTPAAGTCTAQEETDAEYWMFRDSTEPRCSPEKDSDDEEKEETSTDCTPENSPTSVKSPTKKGGETATLSRDHDVIKGLARHYWEREHR
ncbi:182 kDa tankyrase-1-binding protein [Dendrobates tinctorius]|uniref:182 kDa tankyrase-1-binding protein n=1 Tax=Dendrobates tinctorius TaxID=92724 RepID=UPI003CCA3382